jgi:hypothetical protein
MSASPDRFLAEWRHELNRVRVLLDIWHAATPAPLRQELRRRLAALDYLAHEERKATRSREND